MVGVMGAAAIGASSVAGGIAAKALRNPTVGQIKRGVRNTANTVRNTVHSLEDVKNKFGYELGYMFFGGTSANYRKGSVNLQKIIPDDKLSIKTRLLPKLNRAVIAKKAKALYLPLNMIKGDFESGMKDAGFDGLSIKIGPTGNIRFSQQGGFKNERLNQLDGEATTTITNVLEKVINKQIRRMNAKIMLYDKLGDKIGGKRFSWKTRARQKKLSFSYNTNGQTKTIPIDLLAGVLAGETNVFDANTNQDIIGDKDDILKTLKPMFKDSNDFDSIFTEGNLSKPPKELSEEFNKGIKHMNYQEEKQKVSKKSLISNTNQQTNTATQPQNTSQTGLQNTQSQPNVVGDDYLADTYGFPKISDINSLDDDGKKELEKNLNKIKPLVNFDALPPTDPLKVLLIRYQLAA